MDSTVSSAAATIDGNDVRTNTEHAPVVVAVVVKDKISRRVSRTMVRSVKNDGRIVGRNTVTKQFTAERQLTTNNKRAFWILLNMFWLGLG
jgi:hypothetical protein